MVDKNNNEVIVQVVIESKNDDECVLQIQNTGESKFGKEAASTVMKQMAMVLSSLEGNNVTDIKQEEVKNDDAE